MTDIAATCIAAVVFGVDDVDEFSPHSVAGQYITCFANAINILEAASHLDGVLDCDLSLSDSGLDTAMKLTK